MTKGRIRKSRHASGTADLGALAQGGAVRGPSVQIRLAVDDDKPSIAPLLRQAMEMTSAEDPGYIPAVCPSIAAGLKRGQPGFWEALAQEVHRQSEGPAAFALVAENSADAIIGAIVCAPPYEVIRGYINARPTLAMQTMLLGFMALSKIVGVAVSEDYRGNGVGSELIQIARQILQQCGVYVMYSSCSPELIQFYRGLGFEIEPFEAPLNLSRIFDFPALVATPGMHVFHQDLGT
jgi:GNAT superfamily N-acetyltransferase